MFLYAKSYLLQEEHRIQHSLKMEAQTALLAAHDPAKSTPTATPPAPPPAATGSAGGERGGGDRGDRRKKRKAADNRQRNPTSGGTAGGSSAPPPQWSSAHNPWQGVVQAWPFNAWRPGVLAPRPGVHPPPAMVAIATPPQQDSGAIPPGLYSALHGMSLNTPNGGGSDWFMDTGASSHMASHPVILHSHSASSVPRKIVVGNGDLMSSSSTGHTFIPTSTSSALRLNNILIAPQLVKNLISVRALTRDNSVSVEFDPWGFSIKDLRTRMALLRCDSSGELYPLRPAPGTATAPPTQALLSKSDEC